MLLVLLRCLACLLIIFQALPAAAKPKHRPAPEKVVLEEEPEEAAAPPKRSTKTKRAPQPQPEPEPEPEPAPPPAPPPPPPPPPQAVEEEEDESTSGNESSGIECAPAISEIETRRPLPLSCTTTKKEVAQIELRYKAPGRKKWTKVRLRKQNGEFVGDIPCSALPKAGVLRLSIVGMDGNDKPVARIGGVQIQVVEATNQPPPALPGREPPMRCYDPKECPPELKGSPACPGTKATPGARSWGASCEKSSQCQQGLACISGSCDKPPACETSSECASGECVAGHCTFPDPEEVASRLTPKKNWIGLHFGWDFALGKEGNGICGNKTEDGRENWDCYSGSERYKGTPWDYYAGTTAGGLRPSTFRLMASYERWFGRLGTGARLGFAFGGAPKDFQPLHIEARVVYSARPEQLTKRFRPYIGIAGGLARVDSKTKVKIVDCLTTECEKATSQSQLSTTNARQLTLNAYRKGSGGFVGPTLGFLYAFTSESALQFNVDVMLPDFIIAPTLGYVMGL
ncbi:MAG TPA: hypothetical protein VFQ35_08175 [Polyangiaceae bacterium]|nr:hypothetical protein [Polyangiaceae bacterium]